LEVLLQAVAGGFVELTHEVRDGVIVIGTADTLEISEEPIAPARAEVDAGALYGRSRELTHQIQSLELDLAGWEARRAAIQEQIVRAKVESERKLALDQVTQELERIVQAAANRLARTEERYEKKTEPVAVIEDSREQLARARIELARRREELGRSVGGGQIDGFSSELARVAVDAAEKRAQLDILRRQLEEVRRELAKASRFDPQAARIRLAKDTLETTERRVAELKTRLANLQPPTVTMIGLN
jgi:chromosome segregation ATPase